MSELAPTLSDDGTRVVLAGETLTGEEARKLAHQLQRLALQALRTEHLISQARRWEAACAEAMWHDDKVAVLPGLTARGRFTVVNKETALRRMASATGRSVWFKVRQGKRWHRVSCRQQDPHDLPEWALDEAPGPVAKCCEVAGA